MQEGPTRNSPSTSTSDPTTTNTNNNHNNTTITTNEITKKTKRKLTDFYPHLGMIFPIAYSATSNKQADGYVRIAHSSTSRIPPSPSCLHFLPLSLPLFLSLPPPPLPLPACRRSLSRSCRGTACPSPSCARMTYTTSCCRAGTLTAHASVPSRPICASSPPPMPPAPTLSSMYVVDGRRSEERDWGEGGGRRGGRTSTSR